MSRLYQQPPCIFGWHRGTNSASRSAPTMETMIDLCSDPATSVAKAFCSFGVGCQPAHPTTKQARSSDVRCTSATGQINAVDSARRSAANKNFSARFSKNCVGDACVGDCKFAVAVTTRNCGKL